MPHWFAPTHHDHLVAHHGVDPATVLFVDCACGITQRRADYMVDVTALPPAVRAALGITGVDYLCDGCTTRLFRERHITQTEFNRLLGAPPENLALVAPFDDEHQRGVDNRPAHRRPAHTLVDTSGLKPPIGLAGVALAAFVPTVVGGAPLPLQRRQWTHADSVAQLQQRGHLPAAVAAGAIPPPVV